jgi:predicted ATPase/DNA-binding CsgD family transcriptional regulator
LTSFIGRSRELEKALAALAETRLLTLTGTGGAGKTRLALQLAADSLESFDAVCLVELAALAEPELVGEALTAALGVRPLPGLSAIEASCAYLADRRALVVLDNCEHLLASCADLSETLLGACREVRVLATSRTPLGVAGETEWRVPPLDEPDAVRLFVDRARKARPAFTLDEDTAAAITQICVDLDRLPLAIELAAARSRMMAVAQIASEIADRFHLLTGTARAEPRQRTLRASVDWSHDLLTDDERTLFRRLSVFAGAFTLGACERVSCGDGLETGSILDLLTSLVDKSLVVVEQHGPTARYRLLETMREYAFERLTEADGLAATRARHRDWFLDLAEQVAPELEGAAQRARLEQLDGDADNLAAALDYAIETAGERALRLCVALTLWWRLSGRFAAAQQGFNRALEAAGPEASALRARALWGRAHVRGFAGDYAGSLTSAHEALAMSEAVGDNATMGRALLEIGGILLFADLMSSRQPLERAAGLALAAGDEWCHLSARVYLAFSFMFREEWDAGRRLIEQVLPVAERRNLQDIVSYCCAVLGLEAIFGADVERYLALADRGRQASRAIGEPVGEGLADMFTGYLELFQGRPEDALARLEPSREQMVAAGAGMPLAYIECWIATARAMLGDVDGARAELERIADSGAGDFGRGLGFSTLALADVLRAAGDWARAEARANAAREVAERLGSPLLRAWADEVRARALAQQGRYGDAEALLHEALAQRVAYRLYLYLPQTLDAMAEVAAGLDSHTESARILGAAQRTRSDLGLKRSLLDQPRYARLEQSLRVALGDEAFEAAHAEGADLPRDESVAWLRRARGQRKRPARGWESLTPTELQVVALVAGGLTNPQIGQRMFISRGTVKVHLSHIFAKLGVANRAELAAEATRRANA